MLQGRVSRFLCRKKKIICSHLTYQWWTLRSRVKIISQLKVFFVLRKPKGYWCYLQFNVTLLSLRVRTVVYTEKFCFRLGEVLEIVDDLVIDIPKIWTYLAEILCKYNIFVLIFCDFEKKIFFFCDDNHIRCRRKCHAGTFSSTGLMKSLTIYFRRWS